MDELFKFQNSITESMRRENDRLDKIQAENDLDKVITQQRDYCDKLINLKRSLTIMRDRTRKLRRRANKLLEDKNREDIERQRSRERREMLERHLEPVVNTRADA